MGLRTNSWPDFTWLATNATPAASHWGTYIPDLDPPQQEPNNLAGQEFCGSANASEAWGPLDAYGWSDEDCETLLPFVCKVASEWHSGSCWRALQRWCLLCPTPPSLSHPAGPCRQPVGQPCGIWRR